MANEIWMTFDEAFTLYALVWRKTVVKVWNDDDSQFDTYTDADILKYDIPLTNSVDSDYHSVNFPAAISTGIYRVQVMLQVGGAIDADTDYGVGQGEIYWDGTKEVSLYSIQEEVIPGDIIGADGDTLESLSDQLDALLIESNKVHNVYGFEE